MNDRAGRFGSRRGFLVFRPGFLLFCLYAMLYVTLRTSDEIVYQTAPAQYGNQTRTEHIVGPNHSLPRWRRQIYRAFFSPLMVAEEEGRRLGSHGRGLMQRAGEYGRGLLPD